MPMVGVMNAIAHASAAPVSGSKLDNRRVIAAIVDLLIVSAGAVVVLVAGNSLSGDRQGALAAVIVGWALYYYFALESGEGQTLGKKLMKLRVVRADGRRAGMREVGVRTILRVIDNYLVGLIVMLATGERRQRIGDLAAGTIVVDASALAVSPPAPVADVVDEDADADEPEAEAKPEPMATQTITLPPRPTPPEKLSDLTEPEAEEPVAEDDVDDEPAAAAPAILEPRPVPLVEPDVEEEAVVEDEPVLEEEPPVEAKPVVEEPGAEAVPVPVEPAVEVDEDLPELNSPSLEELAQDVAAAHVEPEAEPVEEPADDDEPVNVKSVETVSAMDLIMGAAEEDASSDDRPEDAEDSASS
jgi:uncharacterized RDD family membrane protein YckC